MSDTVTLKKEDLLKAWEKGCSATKTALELLYPGELPPKFDCPIASGSIYKHEDDIYVLTSAHDGSIQNNPPYVLGCITNSGRWSRPKGIGAIKDEGFRPFSGQISLTVKGGKVAGAEVKEN